jgi:hypothetical protein
MLCVILTQSTGYVGGDRAFIGHILLKIKHYVNLVFPSDSLIFMLPKIPQEVP